MRDIVAKVLRIRALGECDHFRTATPSLLESLGNVLVWRQSEERAATPPVRPTAIPSEGGVALSFPVALQGFARFSADF